jgi:hypothetical protein
MAGPEGLEIKQADNHYPDILKKADTSGHGCQKSIW